jgi:hypothetical protein
MPKRKINENYGKNKRIFTIKTINTSEGQGSLPFQNVLPF